jgi:hypothetical protein
MDLPPDLVNGIVALAVENFPKGASELKTSYLIVDSRPRVVQFSFKPDGEDNVRIGVATRRTSRFKMHVDIGGVAGVVAPIVGKQPADFELWVLDGEVPMLIKMDGALYPKGPIWTMALTSPIWPSSSQKKGADAAQPAPSAHR